MEPEPFESHVSDLHEPESHEPDPAALATLSRLERFLAGIQTARHA
jgi:hypothetical protein